MDPTFLQKAKKCYNELLCVVSNEKIAEEFYKIAIDFSFAVSMQRIIEFKIKCRKDIGLKTKKASDPEDISIIKPIVQQPAEEQKQTQQTTSGAQTAQRQIVRQASPAPQVRPTIKQTTSTTTQKTTRTDIDE